jgi:hypothetical protein
MVRVLAVVIGLAVASPAAALDLRLRCEGVATYPVGQSTFAMVGDQTASADTYKRGRSDEVLSIEFTPDGARIQLPPSAIPPLNGGGKAGWWTLSDVVEGEDAVTARFRLNPLNRPTVRVDRLTGDIYLKGSFSLSYQGHCAQVSRAERLF